MRAAIERPDSDTDIMIEIDPEAHVRVWRLLGLKDYIAAVFDGPVDVVDREARKPYVAPGRHGRRDLCRFDPQDTGRWLSDIQHHIAMAERFVASMSDEAFKDDDLRICAVVRCLEIISAASRRLPDELKARHTSIEWREMAAAGNF